MIPLFKVAMSPEAARNVAEVLDSGYIGQGKVVDEFEKDLFYTLPTVATPVTTNSGTSAITLALMLIGVGPGDEVITTSLTCTASNTPIVLAGADIVYADVSSITGNIDPQSVKRLLNEKTKAIICVDWTGRPPEMEALRKVAGDVPIIRDAAHNPTADTDAADYIVFSFGPIKHLCTGDGGALVVHPRRKGDEARARLLRWYGLDRTSSTDFRCAQRIEEAGGKFHMNDINAAIGRTNLKKLTTVVTKHRLNAQRLHTHIVQHAPRHIRLAPFSTASAYWVFPVLLTPDKRDEFIEHMNSFGVMTSRVHARNDMHPALMGVRSGGLQRAAAFDAMQANIPCGWWLSEMDLQKIESALTLWDEMERG
jgi:dTDP-4-amino-4,6-dideoxygalactose transaminase